MPKKESIAKDCPFTEEEIAEFYDMMYRARMGQHATPIPNTSGTYVRQPITPSMLKGHQRMEEDERERMAEEWTKDELKSEISRLQAMLSRMEEEEKDNIPHMQLNLFE